MVGDEVNDVPVALQATFHMDEAGGHHYLAIFLHDLAPDDKIGNAGFIFHRHKDHPFGTAGALADQYNAGQFDPRAIAQSAQVKTGQSSFLLKAGA